MDDNLMLIKQFQMQGGTKGADAAFAEEYRNYQRIQNVYMLSLIHIFLLYGLRGALERLAEVAEKRCH